MRALVTGSAGFIGFHLAGRLLALGHEVVGVDALTPYYDVSLKRKRHELLTRNGRFRAVTAALEDMAALQNAYGDGFDVVVHLAAQAGVRYSLEAPASYVTSNLVGTHNLLELMRARPPRHALIASTSSVYGANQATPFREVDPADHPLSFYAATKKGMEAMTHAYSHLFAMPTTVLRFFTVYGPWGRPDMALFRFVAAICAGRPIDIYGEGRMARDFTYIDDIVEALVRLLPCVPPLPGGGPTRSLIDSLSPQAPWRVVNIGAGRPQPLLDFVGAIEAATGRSAARRYVRGPAGDVPTTWADTSLLHELTRYSPATELAAGVSAFVDWYRATYPT
jgi:UDP-glucuronate 4-epimerase